MGRKFPAILAGVIFSAFSMAIISEARSMETDGLNEKQQKIVAISAFTAKGDLNNLNIALNEGLDAGLTVSEIKEILVQMYAYAGFPRSLNALGAFMGVVEERKRQGIKDEPGREPNPLPADKSRRELGAEVQTILMGAPTSGGVFAFAPAIDAFLKDHLFADIFGRDNLDFQTREIATISALASMEGVNPQLRAHLTIGMNVGLSQAQLESLASVLKSRVGQKEAANAAKVLNKVSSDKGKQ
jgi:alkylhydroperoxidase/carboxymuconolactone decarboxylase family protein YurZ